MQGRALRFGCCAGSAPRLWAEAIQMAYSSCTCSANLGLQLPGSCNAASFVCIGTHLLQSMLRMITATTLETARRKGLTLEVVLRLAHVLAARTSSQEQLQRCVRTIAEQKQAVTHEIGSVFTVNSRVSSYINSATSAVAVLLLFHIHSTWPCVCFLYKDSKHPWVMLSPSSSLAA